MTILFTYNNPDEVQFFKGSCYQTALGCMQVTDILHIGNRSIVSLDLCRFGTPVIILEHAVLSVAIFPLLLKLFKKEGCMFNGLRSFSIAF